VEQRFAAFEHTVEERFAKMDERLARVERRLPAPETKLEGTKAELIKWMFAFWLGMVATVFVPGSSARKRSGSGPCPA
jgi:hypothetical protein